MSIVGIALGKKSCSLVGLDEAGQIVLRRRLKQQSLEGFVGDLAPCIVATEACCGAHHLACLFGRQGHVVRLMSPEYVRPSVKSQKMMTGNRDAEAIAETATRPTMRFVPVMSELQPNIQALHRTSGARTFHRDTDGTDQSPVCAAALSECRCPSRPPQAGSYPL